MPVGSTHTARVDVRVVAATHLPLEERIESGAFRRDLYARLAGYTFAVPALRDRRVDLGLLVAALRSDGKLGPRRDVRLHGETARALVRHDWPMNVRELAQCLHAACMLAEDGEITPDDLPPAIATSPEGAPVRPPEDPSASAPAAPGAAQASRTDRRAEIVALIAEHRGNLSAVARALRTSRSQLQRLLVRFGIDSRA
jgi:transcriptional regulator of acetoin/glycerol metabolism